MRLLLALALVSPAAAQDPALDEPAFIEGVVPGARPAPEAVNQLAYAIGLKIRCPVCQGLSISDSTSPAAVQMQRKVRDLVAAGYQEPEIIDYFVERYGEFLILQPDMNDAQNWPIWIGPGLLLGVGVALALRQVLAWRKEPEDPVPGGAPEAGPVKDKFEQRLLAELED